MLQGDNTILPGTEDRRYLLPFKTDPTDYTSTTFGSEFICVLKKHIAHIFDYELIMPTALIRWKNTPLSPEDAAERYTKKDLTPEAK